MHLHISSDERSHPTGFIQLVRKAALDDVSEMRLVNHFAGTVCGLVILVVYLLDIICKGCKFIFIVEVIPSLGFYAKRFELAVPVTLSFLIFS